MWQTDTRTAGGGGSVRLPAIDATPRSPMGGRRQQPHPPLPSSRALTSHTGQHYGDVSGSRIVQLESRIDGAERSNRALLEETVRLQNELKSMVRRSEAQIAEERQNRSYLSENTKTNNSIVAQLQMKVRQLEDALQSDTKTVNSVIQHVQQFEKTVLSDQQQGSLSGNETKNMLGLLTKDMQSLRNELAQQRNDNEKTLRHLTEDMRQLKMATEMQTVEARTVMGDLKQRAQKLEVELRATVDVVMKLRDTTTRGESASAATKLELESKIHTLNESYSHCNDRITQSMTENMSRNAETRNACSELGNIVAQQGHRVEEVASQVLQEVNQVRGAQESDKSVFLNQVAEGLEAHIRRYADFEERIEQSVRAQIMTAQVDFKKESAQRETFEHEMREMQKVHQQSLQGSLGKELAELRTMFKMAKFDANESLRELNEGISLLERDVTTARHNYEQVLKAEINSRQQASSQAATAIKELQAQLNNRQQALTTKVQEMSTTLSTISEETRTSLQRDIKEAKQESSRGITDVETRHAALQQNMKRLEGMITSQITQMNENMAQQMGRIQNTQHTRIEQLEQQVRSMTAQLASLPEDINLAKHLARDTKDAINVQLQAEREARMAEMSTVNAAVSTRTGTDDAREHHLKDLEARLSDMEANLQQAASKTSSTEWEIENVKNSMTSKMASEANVRNEAIMDLRQQLARLMARTGGQPLTQTRDQPSGDRDLVAPRQPAKEPVTPLNLKSVATRSFHTAQGRNDLVNVEDEDGDDDEDDNDERNDKPTNNGMYGMKHQLSPYPHSRPGPGFSFRHNEEEDELEETTDDDHLATIREEEGECEEEEQGEEEDEYEEEEEGEEEESPQVSVPFHGYFSNADARPQVLGLESSRPLHRENTEEEEYEEHDEGSEGTEEEMNDDDDQYGHEDDGESIIRASSGRSQHSHNSIRSRSSSIHSNANFQGNSPPSHENNDSSDNEDQQRSSSRSSRRSRHSSRPRSSRSDASDSSLP